MASINATTSSGIVATADNTGTLQLQTAGTNAINIDASQRAAFVAGTAALPAITTSGDTNTGMFFPAADTIAFAEGGVEQMRLDANGNVGIGTSSPTYKLDISSGSSNTLNITTSNTNTTIFNITRSTVTTVTHTLDNTGYKIINGGSGGLYLGFTGTSWISLSDERFKTDLKPIENAAEKVSTLRAVTGRFKTDDEGKSRAFLIAQDIQEVLPEAVDTSNSEQLGVSYTDTIPLLVAAIKELTERVKELENT